MSVDRFLLFWSLHNQTIIQILIVLTLIFIVALVFLTLFGAKDEASDRSAQSQLTMTPDLEKSLQKMLENQTQSKSAVFDFSRGPAADSAGAGTAGADTSQAAAAATAQLEKVKAEMATREKTIHDLKIQLEQVQAEAQKNQSSAGGSGLESRIKELEARLAEYDIISEDIADLSRFKEENENLKKQIAQMGNRPAPVAAASVIAAPPPPPPPPVALEPVPEPVPEPAPVEVAAELTPVPPPVAEPTPEVSAAIDDDLMKEFAAAVENQKASTAAATPPPPPPSAENEDLMGQFENFVAKKEGS